MDSEHAREFFRSFNGSSFHMSREEPQKLEQFRALNISDRQKDLWRLEMAQEYLDKIGPDNPRSWSLFSSMTSVLRDIKSFYDCQEAMFLQGIEKQAECDLLTRTISLETVCGRTYDCHDGIIAYFRKQGYDLGRLRKATDRLFVNERSDDLRLQRAIQTYRSLIGQ